MAVPLMGLSPFYPSALSPCLFLSSHHSSMLLVLVWHEVTDVAGPLPPERRASCFFISCVFLSPLLTHQAGAVGTEQCNQHLYF